MTDLAAILRTRTTVTEIPGWRTHVRPGSWAPLGLMVHHTAGTNSLGVIVRGRPDLPGPLSNLHIPKSGPVNLVSAGRCNHAGAGAQVVLDEVRAGRAPSGDAVARGLIDGPGGNGYFYGFECENLGDGRDPWPEGQLTTIAAAAAAICSHHGWSANRVIGHREWTRRKPDPSGFAMDDMRARVHRLLIPPEDDMPKPTDFTSSCRADGAGFFTQTAEGGVDGHDGAVVSPDGVKRTYKDHAAQLGPRTFLAIIPNGVGGVVQIATDGTRWNSKDWT